MVTYKLRPLDTLKQIDFEAYNIEPSMIVTNSIAEIDNFTSAFNDEKDFKDYLKKYFQVGENSDLFIYYKYKGDRKTRLLYGNDLGFMNYIEEGKLKLSDLTPYFIKDFNSFIHAKDEYIKYMHDAGFISDHLFGAVTKYKYYRHYEPDSIEEKETKENLLKSMKDEMRNYKTLRDIYVGTKSYEKMKGTLKEVLAAPKKNPFLPKETEYLDEEKQEILDTFMRADSEELDEFRDIIPENVMKRIEEQEFFQKTR